MFAWFRKLFASDQPPVNASRRRLFKAVAGTAALAGVPALESFALYDRMADAVLTYPDALTHKAFTLPCGALPYSVVLRGIPAPCPILQPLLVELSRPATDNFQVLTGVVAALVRKIQAASPGRVLPTVAEFSDRFRDVAATRIATPRFYGDACTLTTGDVANMLRSLIDVMETVHERFDGWLYEITPVEHCVSRDAYTLSVMFWCTVKAVKTAT